VPAAKETAAGNPEATDDAAGSSDEAAADIDLLGLTVQPVDRDAVEQFELKPEQRGLMVTGVTPGGPAQGEIAEPANGGPDIILSVEGKSVKTVADLKQALKGDKSGDIVTLRLYNTQAKAHRIERIRLAE
jgi:S1-C subfamily serine protease